MDCHNSNCKHIQKPVRSLQQNKALWLFFKLLADELNSAGYSIQEVLKNYKAELSWSKDSIHDIMWLPIQKGLLKTDSTKKLKKHEIDIVYEHINRFVSQMGIHVPFPIDEQRQKEKQYLGAPEVKNYPSGHTPTAFE